jgi:hypothetical protein
MLLTKSSQVCKQNGKEVFNAGLKKNGIITSCSNVATVATVL